MSPGKLFDLWEYSNPPKNVGQLIQGHFSLGIFKKGISILWKLFDILLVLIL